MTSTTTRPARPRRPPLEPTVGPLGRLAGVTYRHRGRDRAGLGGRAGRSPSCSPRAFGGEFKADYSAPGLGLQRGADAARGPVPGQAGDTVDVVVHADGGRATARRSAADVTDAARRARRTCRTSSASTTRYATPGGVCPDGRTLVAHARLDVVNPPDMPVEDSQRLLDVADAASTAGPAGRARRPDHPAGRAGRHRLRGPRPRGRRDHPALMFGSVVAAGLPILVAVAGLAVSSTLTTVADLVRRRARLVHLAGHDDGHRHRHRLRAADGHPLPRVAGRRPRPARPRRSRPWTPPAARSCVAGSTVVISMLGLFAMGLSFMRGAAVVTILARPRRAWRRASRCSRRCSATSAGTSTGCGCRWADGARSRSRRRRARRAVTRLARAGAGCRAAPGRRGASPAWRSCWRWPRRSSASGSASPTPATTARARSTRQAYDQHRRAASGPG